MTESDLLQRLLQRLFSEVDPPSMKPNVPKRVMMRRAALLMSFAAGSLALVVGAVAVVGALRSDTRVPPASTATGFVYISDAKSLENPEIIVVDGRDRNVIARWPTGFDASFTMSPRGQLVVASLEGTADERSNTIAVLDPRTGEVEADAILDRPRGPQRILSTGFRCCSAMDISRDGRWLYYLQRTQGDAGVGESFLGTFNLDSMRALPRSVPIPGCVGFEPILPLADSLEVAVACTPANEIRFLRILRSGDVKDEVRLSIPRTPDERTDAQGNDLDLGTLAWAVSSPDATKIYAVTQNGHVYVVDTNSREIVDEVQLALPDQLSVSQGKVIVSPDGQRLFLGVSPIDDYDPVAASRIWEVSISDWQVEDRLSLDEPFYNWDINPSSDTLYFSNFSEGSLGLVNLNPLSLTGVLKNIGGSPQLLETR